MNGSPPKKGDIYWVSLNPSLGSETKKTRPCLVISNDIGNEKSGVVIVAPITSSVNKVYPFEVALSVDGKNGKAMVNQCRAIDKSRLKKKIGKVDDAILNEVHIAIKIVFGLQ